MHTKVKPFVCDECGKAFARQGDLHLHARRHTGTKPFKCPDCDMAFVTSCELGGHHNRVHRKEDDATKSIADIRHRIELPELPQDSTVEASGLGESDRSRHKSEITAVAGSVPAVARGACTKTTCSCAAPTLLDAMELLQPQAFGWDDEGGSCVGCDIDHDATLGPKGDLCRTEDCGHPGGLHGDHRDCWVRCKKGELHLHHTGVDGLEGLHHIWKYNHTCDRGDSTDIGSLLDLDPHLSEGRLDKGERHAPHSGAASLHHSDQDHGDGDDMHSHEVFGLQPRLPDVPLRSQAVHPTKGMRHVPRFAAVNLHHAHRDRGHSQPCDRGANRHTMETLLDLNPHMSESSQGKQEQHTTAPSLDYAQEHVDGDETHPNEVYGLLPRLPDVPLRSPSMQPTKGMRHVPRFAAVNLHHAPRHSFAPVSCDLERPSFFFDPEF